MTRATNESPTKRLMLGAPSTFGVKRAEYVVELDAMHITIRPKGTRKGGPAEVVLSVGTVYNRALMDRCKPITSGRKVRRGLS